MSHEESCRCPSCAHSICRRVAPQLFPVFQIFDRPLDHPNRVVVRLFTGEQPTEFMWLHLSVEEARRTLRPLGLALIPRSPDDPPFHVESWL